MARSPDLAGDSQLVIILPTCSGFQSDHSQTQRPLNLLPNVNLNIPTLAKTKTIRWKLEIFKDVYSTITVLLPDLELLTETETASEIIWSMTA